MNSGAMDQRVKPAEPSDCCIYCSGAILALRHVASEDSDGLAVFRNALLKCTFVPIKDRDTRAACQHLIGTGLADTACGTSDQDREVVHSATLFLKMK